MPFINEYPAIYTPGHPKGNSRGYVYEHILLAEKALGHSLPKQAQVHHANEIKTDNTMGNLVICEDAAYHKLLHRRTEALKISGNVENNKCRYCKTYDDQDGMKISTTKNNWHRAEHQECARRTWRNQIRPKRHYKPKEQPRQYHPKGMLNSSAKLTDEAVGEIRSSSYSLRLLAVQFGVSKTTIADIKRWRTWTHLI